MMKVVKSICLVVAVVSVCLAATATFGETITLETFEDAVKNYAITGEDTDHDINPPHQVWAELAEITNGPVNVTFSGQEGSDYFYGQNTNFDTNKSITFSGIDVTGLADLQVVIALAANVNVWDQTPDNMTILLDKDNDAVFETTLADFIYQGTGSSNLTDGTYILNTTFQDATYDVPVDAGDTIGLKITFVTSNDDYEAVGIDNIRIVVVPEPSTLTLAAFGLLGLGFYGWRWRRSS